MRDEDIKRIIGEWMPPEMVSNCVVLNFGRAVAQAARDEATAEACRACEDAALKWKATGDNYDEDRDDSMALVCWHKQEAAMFLESDIRSRAATGRAADASPYTPNPLLPALIRSSAKPAPGKGGDK